MSKSHRNPKIKNNQSALRHRSRRRDRWRCQNCNDVTCPKGSECYRTSHWQRRKAKFKGKIVIVKEEFKEFKKGFCKGGSDCVLRMHHKVQLVFGGRDTMHNVVTLCKECHKKISHIN